MCAYGGTRWDGLPFFKAELMGVWGLRPQWGGEGGEAQQQ